MFAILSRMTTKSLDRNSVFPKSKRKKAPKSIFKKKGQGGGEELEKQEK